MIVGITGFYRAGKGVVAEYFVSQKGFKHYSVSGYITEFLEKEGVKVDSREILIKTGNEIRASLGGDFIVKELVQKARLEGKDAIIESIRCPKEAEFIKSQKDSCLIAVDAEPAVRYHRAIAVSGIKDKVTFEEFVASEQREYYSNDPNAQNIGRCIEMADFKILNNSTLESLHQQIGEIITEIERGGKERK